MRLPTLLLLAACAPSALPLDAQVPPPTLTLQGPPTIAIGETLTLTVSGALVPNEQVYFARGTGIGGGPCLGFAGGLCIDLENPEVLGAARADANGVATLEIDVPRQAPVGLDIGLQALTVRGIGGSNSEYTNALLLTTSDDVEGCTDPVAINFDPAAVLDDGSCTNFACGGGLCTETFAQAETPDTPVDILMVIDNSTSMDGVSGALALQSFFLPEVLFRSTNNWKVGVISTDMLNPSESGRIQTVVTSNSLGPEFLLNTALSLGATSNANPRAFDATLTALSPSMAAGANAGFRRPGALLSVGVFSTGDDASQGSVIDFVDNLETLAGGPVNYHAFTPSETGVNVLGLISGCSLFSLVANASAPAPRHVEAASLTGGFWSSVCGLNTGPFFDRLIPPSITTGIVTSFELSCAPANTAIEVRVNGGLVPFDSNNGWSYDPGFGTIDFHGVEVPEVGAVIEVIYPASSACP